MERVLNQKNIKIIEKAIKRKLREDKFQSYIYRKIYYGIDEHLVILLEINMKPPNRKDGEKYKQT